MAQEIERKFLVTGEGWRDGAHASVHCVQGYLASDASCSIRVRIAGERAWLGIKGANLGIERTEFEYRIPLADARELLARFCVRPLIEKTRHYLHYGGHLWEIDEFAGENAGLVVAELELERVDEPFERPPWLGDEVSADPRYYNVSLVTRPYGRW